MRSMGDLASLQRIVVVRTKGTPCEMKAGRDVYYDEILAAAEPECEAEPLDAEHPLFILYTSGSTAKPKGILHTTGGYLTGVSATHRYVFDLNPETDVYWCAADVGWITGHSYIVYGPLANGATSVMWEGAPDYPDKGIWWELDRALRRDHPLLRAHRDPRLHQVGRQWPKSTTSPRCACWAPSASRSTPRRGSGTTR